MVSNSLFQELQQILQTLKQQRSPEHDTTTLSLCRKYISLILTMQFKILFFFIMSQTYKLDLPIMKCLEHKVGTIIRHSYVSAKFRFEFQ